MQALLWIFCLFLGFVLLWFCELLELVALNSPNPVITGMDHSTRQDWILQKGAPETSEYHTQRLGVELGTAHVLSKLSLVFAGV